MEMHTRYKQRKFRNLFYEFAISDRSLLRKLLAKLGLAYRIIDVSLSVRDELLAFLGILYYA